MGFGDQTRLEARHAQDLAAGRGRRRRALRRRLPRRADPRRGRPRRRRRGHVHATRTARPPASSCARRRSSSPRARSTRRRCCCARASAAPRPATTCACIPATVVAGIYDSPQKGWWGAPQTGLSAQFADVEDGYGFLIETSHASPGVTGSAVPWRSGEEHKRLMASGRTTAAFVMLLRDRGHGRVEIDAAGNPVHWYPMDDALDHAPLQARAGRARAAPRSRGRRGDPQLPPQARRHGSAAATSRIDSYVAARRGGAARAVRARDLLAASHGLGAARRRPRRPASRTPGGAA